MSGALDTSTPGPSAVVSGPAGTRRAGRFIVAHVAALVIAGLAVALRDTTGAATFVVLAYLAFAPGDALRAALQVRSDDVHVRVVLAATGSVFLLILAALVSSVVVGTLGAPLGIAALGAGPLFTTLALLVLGCLAAVAFSRRQVVAAVPRPMQWLAWGVLALLAQAAWIGAKALDLGHGPWITGSALALLGAAVVWAAVSRRAEADLLRPALIFFLTLAVAWSFSQRTDHLYGFDIHQEHLWAQRTLTAGVWERHAGDPYAAMLSITAFPAALVSLSGLDLVDYFKAFAPLTFALYAMATFCFVGRFAPRRAAYAVTLLVVMVPQALWQLPAVSRQEVALLAFATLMLLLFGAGGTETGARVFAACAALTLAVTHYTSAYVALAVLAGGLFLSFLLRLLRPNLRSAPRHLSVAVIAALAIGAIGWNAVYTGSTGNLDSAVDTTGDSGLRQDRDPISTFLNGANIAEVPPAEYFAETRIDARERPWLVPYSDGLQRRLAAETRGIELPEQYGPAGVLDPVSVLLYLLLKQGSNLLMAAGTVYLAWRLLRRRGASGDGPDGTAGPDLLAVALVALAITAMTRFNAELSQAYNPERLLLQTAFFLGPPAALLGSRLMRTLRGAPLLRQHPSVTGRLPRVAVGVLAALLVFDATGLRALLISQDSGNLQPDGEYARRFAVSEADLAAASWLGDRFQRDDMVFADNYGALIVQGMPAFTQGIFGEISPYTLDQRAYVLATTENVRGGRARAVKRSVRTTFAFPERFLSTYKSRIYSNGSAEVYR